MRVRRSRHWRGMGRLWAAFGAAMLFHNGCGPAASPAPPRAVVPPGKAVIVGTVKLAGPSPTRREIPNSACHRGGANAPDETIVADADGGLANVVVYLKDAPNVALPPSEPALLDQVDCQYVPHVVAVRTGQTLRLRSSDATLHNVHGQAEANPAFNYGMTTAGQTRDVSFSRPETFRVTCDVHPWMRAYVAVFDHPLFAVTDAEGRFTIRHAPPGDYTLVAWHERLRTVERPIAIPPGASAEEPVKVDLTFGGG